ncbi:MAG: DNA replication/repair protein RecF [Ignavibacteria bacterium]|nr:DNA replication and repair protein RecF [Ignavibacteria bacterium]MCC7158685.1 DNA replication/repair protein RecF [Ignavibacteria bacterium]
MFLENLSLENFKNYSSSSFSFSPKLNFIYGENGNGKTNILEAISMLCYTRSFLLNSDNDCVKYGNNNFNIKGEFTSGININSTLRYSYNKDTASKSLLYGNDKVTRLNEFIGSFPLIVLSPGDLKLSMGTPLDKRRNFDLLISQVSRLYFDDLKSYTKVIKQKNSLLKENLVNRKYSSKDLKNMLGLWNEELVSFGIKILLRRLDFIEEFRSYQAECFNRIAGSSYLPVINYESDINTDSDNLGIDALRRSYSELLESKMDTEIKRGISLAGPHRDNYIFLMEKNGDLFDMRTFASQGEHKTFVVSLKLAEFGFIKDNIANSNIGDPILLLDDIFSELDKGRIKKISSLITGFNQVFLTTTDKEYMDTLREDFDEISAYHITKELPSLVNQL